MIIYDVKYGNEYLDFIKNSHNELSDEEYQIKYDNVFNAYFNYVCELRDIMYDYLLMLPKSYNNKDLENMGLLGYCKLSANKSVELEKYFKEAAELFNSSDFDVIKHTNNIIETLNLLINAYNKIYSVIGKLNG